MDFGLSEEQELLQETLRSFIARDCPPTRLREIFDADAGHDPAHWNALVEMGVAGLVIPEAYGGAGLELLDLALVAEVLGEGAFPSPFFGHSLASLAIVLGGSDAQKESWLPRLASGDVLGTIAFGEGDESWDPSAWQMRRVDEKLTGMKGYVPHANVADLIVVGLAGGELALVERSAEGVKLEAIDAVDRTRPLYKLSLDAVVAEVLAVAAASRVRDAGLVLLAADAFGSASKLVEMSVEYAKTRQQFGQVIGQFQAVKHQLADMTTAIEPARGLFWHAAYAFDHLPDEAERGAALAKAHLTDVFMQTARDAVEAHGGIGFTWESDVQIWFKRAMFDRAFLGTPPGHRERAATLAGW